MLKIGRSNSIFFSFKFLEKLRQNAANFCRSKFSMLKNSAFKRRFFLRFLKRKNSPLKRHFFHLFKKRFHFFLDVFPKIHQFYRIFFHLLFLLGLWCKLRNFHRIPFIIHRDKNDNAMRFLFEFLPLDISRKNIDCNVHAGSPRVDDFSFYFHNMPNFYR